MASVAQALPDGVLPQRTQEFSCSYLYLRIKIHFPQKPGIQVTEQLFVHVLQAALSQLFGAVGGALSYSLLQYSQPPGGSAAAVLRVERRDGEKLWSACACATQYDGNAVRLIVTAASHFLSALAHDSREMVLMQLPRSPDGARGCWNAAHFTSPVAHGSPADTRPRTAASPLGVAP